MISTSPYVTTREAAHILGINEGKLMALTQEKKLQVFHIAGQYIRFKRADILSLKNSGSVVSETVKFPYTWQERLHDIIAYNDFYIASFIVIVILLSVIFFFKP